jgi:nitronate monooxygenase
MKKKLFVDLKLPLIQAPMAGFQDHELAVAVTTAGGLGSLACALLDPDALREELSAIRSHTEGPINLNFFCHDPAVENPDQEAQWQETLRPLYSEFGVGQGGTIPGSRLEPFNHAVADVLEEFGPDIVSFHFGLPAEDLLIRVKDMGATILSSATTVDEARWLESQGVDAVIAQGVEAGGHRGMFLSDDLDTQIGTSILLPEVIDAIDIPVIAAGGISDARGVAEALKKGAIAVQAGTAFLLCHEARTSELHRAAIKADSSPETAVTNVFTGRPARSITNRMVREIGPINATAPAFPMAGSALSELRSLAESNGSADFTPLWCGENTAGCSDISAADQVRNLAALIE